MAAHPRHSLGIGRGGRRTGAGRPPGARNRRQQELIAKAKAESLEMPLDRLLRRMNSPDLAEEYRDQLAIAAAPYVSPRLTAVAIQKRPAQMSDEEIAALIEQAEEDLSGKWPRPVH